MASVLEVASRVSTPLALGGLFAAILFLIFRQLLRLKIFPKLARKEGYTLLRVVVDRLFFLALVAMILGAIAFVFGQWQASDPDGSPESTDRDEQIALAEEALQLFHAGDYEGAFGVFGPLVRGQYTFVQFRDAMARELFQLPAAPLFVRFQQIDRVAGFLRVSFAAEFDSITTWREDVIFAEGERGWELYQITPYPASWPPTQSMQALAVRSAGELAEAMNREGAQGSDYLGRWVGLPGWRVITRSAVAKEGEHTCDLTVEEVGTGATIVVENALGGCALAAGERLLVVGKVSDIREEEIQLSEVRYWPAGAK